MKETSKKPAKRLPLVLNVEFRKSYARQDAKGVLKNISLTGAFLETDISDMAPSDKLVITFQVSERVRKMSGTVIWKNGRGYGIQFQPFNKRDVQIVDDLMYFIESRRESQKEVLENILKQVS